MSSPTTQATDNGRDAHLILRNARITTLDPARPTATALAVTDGIISRVGDEADVLKLAGPATRIVDGLNRRVVPGLIDSHLHIIRGGNHFGLELRWDGVSSLAEGLHMLREQASRTPHPASGCKSSAARPPPNSARTGCQLSPRSTRRRRTRRS